MNTGDGLRRIAAAVRWTGIGAAVLLFMFWAVSTSDNPSRMGGAMAMTAFAAFFAGAGWLLGWIIRLCKGEGR
jgi:hypothetical protein